LTARIETEKSTSTHFCVEENKEKQRVLWEREKKNPPSRGEGPSQRLVVRVDLPRGGSKSPQVHLYRKCSSRKGGGGEGGLSSSGAEGGAS